MNVHEHQLFARVFFQCELHATWHIISSIFINILDPPDITRCDQLQYISSTYVKMLSIRYSASPCTGSPDIIMMMRISSLKTRPSTFFDGCPYSYG